MAENAKNKKNTGLIVGICCAVAAVVIVVVLAVVLATRGGIGGVSDMYFTSDGSKYVLTLESSDIVTSEGEIAPVKMHLVYYYNGDLITGEKSYYEFADTETAKSAYEFYKENSGEAYENVALDGKYVVLTAKAEDYDGITATDIKQQIEFMEMLKGMTFDEGTEEVIESSGEEIEVQ